MKKMLKYTIISISLISSLYANSIYDDPIKDNVETLKKIEKVKWLDFKTVYNKSIKNKNSKPMLIMVGSTTCHFCKTAKSIIDNNSKISNYINKHFSPVYISQDKDFIPVDLIVPGTPGFWITSNEGKPLFEVKLGMENEDSFLEYLKLIEIIKVN